VVTAIVIIYRYASGASESYTHRDIADIRSWYFNYVLTEQIAQAAIVDRVRANENQDILRKALQRFVASWLEFENRPSGFIAEDLQQVFILYLFQMMRRRSLRDMISAVRTGAGIIAVMLILTILCAAFRVEWSKN
jgi:hypothetical protein